VDASVLIDWITRHQATLSWLGGGVATAAGGAWAVARHLLDRPDREADKPAKPAAKSFGHHVSTGTGIAAARDLRIAGGVTIQHGGVPAAAIVLAGLGLLLLGYAAFGSRAGVGNHDGPQTTISAPGGVAAQAITGSPITIGAQPPPPAPGK
jgi:hypothetical protein